MDGHGQHHLHTRRRLYQHLEPYPHPNRLIRLMDEAAYVVGILAPLFSLPQLYQIWHEKSAVGASLISWSAFTVGSMFWLYYGILHKEKPIIISQSLWFVLQLIIVIGILLYK